MKTTCKIIVFLLAILAATACAETQGEAFLQMLEQWQKTPNDNALREKIINVAQELNPLPALPEEAELFEKRAQSAFKNVKTTADCLNVAREYEKAVAAAPWVPGYYADLCIIYGMADNFVEAKRSCEFFLASSPPEQDVSETRIHLAELESARQKFAMRKADEMKRRKVFRDCPDCPEMVVIPPGSFEMGDAGAHQVALKGFAMGKTEVTQGQWKAIMGNNPSMFSSCGDNCPVEQVSWDDAQDFIRKFNTKTGKQYRLPSEAEWEYACRAGSRYTYCGSDSLDNVGWHHGVLIFGGNSNDTSHRVATKQANAFGLYDMSGNVSEWVEDSFHVNYNGAPTDGSAWQGDGVTRVHRGGSWQVGSEVSRATERSWSGPAVRSSGNGFRLARMLQ